MRQGRRWIYEPLRREEWVVPPGLELFLNLSQR